MFSSLSSKRGYRTILDGWLVWKVRKVANERRRKIQTLAPETLKKKNISNGGSMAPAGQQRFFGTARVIPRTPISVRDNCFVGASTSGTIIFKISAPLPDKVDHSEAPFTNQVDSKSCILILNFRWYIGIKILIVKSCGLRKCCGKAGRREGAPFELGILTGRFAVSTICQAWQVDHR